LLAQSCFGLNPVLARSPGDCFPSGPLWFAPELSWILSNHQSIHQADILANYSMIIRLSSGIESSRRVIADWSPVGFNFLPIKSIYHENASRSKRQKVSYPQAHGPILWINMGRAVEVLYFKTGFLLKHY